jgi:hypothetical protein
MTEYNAKKSQAKCVSIQESQFLAFEDAMGLLRAEIAASGSQLEWAKNKNVDRATLNGALQGRRKLQPKVLKALGLEQVTVYRRLQEPHEDGR